jgi:hypothetical protein
VLGEKIGNELIRVVIDPLRLRLRLCAEQPQYFYSLLCVRSCVIFIKWCRPSWAPASKVLRGW